MRISRRGWENNILPIGICKETGDTYVVPSNATETTNTSSKLTTPRTSRCNTSVCNNLVVNLKETIFIRKTLDWIYLNFSCRGIEIRINRSFSYNCFWHQVINLDIAIKIIDKVYIATLLFKRKIILLEKFNCFWKVCN